MSKPNDFNDIERELQFFPNHKLHKIKQHQMHKNLMETTDQLDKKERRAQVVKRTILGFVGVAAILLFGFLAMTFNSANKPYNSAAEPHEEKHETTENVKHFTELINGDIGKITASTNENGGNKVRYSSSDRSIINQFKNSIGTMKFKQTDKSSSVFKTTFELYNKDNEKMASMTFIGKNIVSVNGIHYEIDETKLIAFTDVFFRSNYKVTTESIIKEKAKAIMTALSEQNMELVAQHVHPEKGVTFSPYIYVNKDAVQFEKSEINSLLEDQQQYLWGYQDGSGKPIELTAEEYFKSYIYDADYKQPDETNFDSNKQRGNTINNINEVFPNSHVVEFYNAGTKVNGNMDWKSLNLVFQQDQQGEWKLVAIIHNQWTI